MELTRYISLIRKDIRRDRKVSSRHGKVPSPALSKFGRINLTLNPQGLILWVEWQDEAEPVLALEWTFQSKSRVLINWTYRDRFNHKVASSITEAPEGLRTEGEVLGAILELVEHGTNCPYKDSEQAKLWLDIWDRVHVSGGDYMRKTKKATLTEVAERGS